MSFDPILLPARQPVAYSEQLGAEVCRLIADEGKTLRQIAKIDGMPSTMTILRWKAKHPEFKELYDYAMQARWDHGCEEMIAIAKGEPGEDYIAKLQAEKDKAEGIVSARAPDEPIQRSRLRIETHQWIMAKRQPKIYGEPAQGAVAAPAEDDTTPQTNKAEATVIKWLDEARANKQKGAA